MNKTNLWIKKIEKRQPFVEFIAEKRKIALKRNMQFYILCAHHHSHSLALHNPMTTLSVQC